MSVEGRRRRSQRPRGQPVEPMFASEEDRQTYLRQQKLQTPIAEMKLSTRVVNTLEECNLIICADLMRQTYESLMEIQNFGEKTLGEVRAAITLLGLEPPAWTPPVKKPPVRRKKGQSLIDLW